MQFSGFKGKPQRLAGAKQVRLPDHVGERLRAQQFGERRVGGGGKQI